MYFVVCEINNVHSYWILVFNIPLFTFTGYDPQVPIDSMQGLDLGSQSGNQYGPMDNLDIGPHGDLSFGNMDGQGMAPPQQGGDNAPGMGQQWFDTDL